MQPLPVVADPKFWNGVVAEPPLPGARLDVVAAGPIVGESAWFDWCSPSLNQNGSSCVGWSWAHWMTGMIRRHVDPRAFAGGWQINGQAIWYTGRRMFWNGTTDGGIYLREGLTAARELGIVPPDTALQSVGTDWDSVGLALRATPIVQGHAIHNGWFDPDSESGCIDHEPKASGANGYHATLRIGRLTKDGRNYYVLQNSWGATWGRYGYGLMTVEEDAEGLMSPGLFTAKLPDDWRTWEGWRKCLIKP